MKQLSFIKHASLPTSVIVFLLAMLISPVSYAADAMADFAPDEIVAELKPKLDLNDKQVRNLTAALGELGKNLAALIAKQEAAGEEDDPKDFIKGIKQAQTEYQKKLKGILDDKQQQTYSDLRETAIMDMMKDLAEIKLLDIQPKIGFSDEQLKKLVPAIGESMRGFMKIAWENADKRLRLRQKIKIAKSLKKIQSNTQQQIQQILTGEQYQKWEEIKRQQQAK